MEQNLYEIEYKKDLLFLNCPQCKQTPNFEFVKNDFNVEYPDYYQKMNMELIIPIFDKKIN